MTWKRIHDPQEPVHALVAEQGGELLGLTHYLYHRSTTTIGPNCYLQDLFTVPRRAEGVARALINGVYEQASSPDRRASIGRPTKPTTPRCSFTTRWRSIPASSSTARCSDTLP